MEKESLRILTRHLNGYKKVCCREFILRRRKYQHAQTRFSTQPPKQDIQRLNITLELCLNMEKESLRILTRHSNGYKKVCCREFILRRRKYQHAQTRFSTQPRKQDR